VEEQNQTHRYMRQIRSFVLREGRLTEGQERALAELMPRFGVELPAGELDLGAIFGRGAPKILEIGFGNGESLAEMAKLHPERDYLGIEVHRPGVGHLLLKLEREGIENVRVLCADAQQVLKEHIADESLGGLQLYFADPWPKKRHHKRRIVQPEWAALLRRKLTIGGFLHMATDWENYAEHMREVMDNAPGYRNEAGTAGFIPRPADRPETKFEARGKRRGHGVWDLLYTRIS
jgi:tRNA (guanine-N7-)-methyltransferase